MKRAGGIAILAAALGAQGANAQQVKVAVFGKTQPAVLTQRNGAAVTSGSEFTLYELNVWKPQTPVQASEAPVEAEPVSVVTDAEQAPSEATVLPMMAAAFSGLARPQAPVRQLAVAPCGGPISIAPLRTSISASTYMARRTFYPIVREAECRYGLPTGLMDSVVIQESRYNPMIVSPKGAGGLSQLMPLTALGLGVTNRFDPRANVNGGARYLRQLLDKFGSVPLALAAYNAGPGSVMKARGIPQNRETPTYVRNVLSYWREPVGIFQNPTSEAHRMAVMLGFMTN